MAILLTDIRELGLNVYQLQFLDEGEPLSFTFAYHPDRGRCEGNQEFLDHFEGRTAGREAMRALGMLIEGHSVRFPVEIRQTGGTNRF